MAFVYFAIICLLFGSNFMLMDRASQVFGPFSVGLARIWGGAAVLGIVMYFSRHRLALNRNTLGKIAFVALLSNAYPFAVQPWLLQKGVDHSFLAMFVPFTPLLTIMASVPILGIRPTWQQTIGVLGGLALLVWMSGDAESHNLSVWLIPVVLTVPLSYAIGNTFMRRNLQQVPGIVVSTMLLAIGGCVLLPLAANEVLQNPPTGTATEWTHAIQALLVLGPLGTGACIGLFVQLVQDRGPLFAGMVTYVVPIIALGWGYRDSETISTSQIVAIVGILGLVALVQSSNPERSHSSTASRP